MSDASDQALAEWDIRQHLAGSRTAEVIDLDLPAHLARVEVGGIEHIMPWMGVAPQPGAEVRVAVLGEVSFCQVVEGSPLGEVTALDVGNRVATVTGEDGTAYVYRYSPDQALVVGDKVALDHARHLVLLRLTTAPPPPPPESAPAAPKPKPPAPQPVTRTRDFFPTWSATWHNGRYTNLAQVNVGSTQVGAYGYGTAIRDTIPNNAAILSATLNLDQISDRLPHIASLWGTHTANGRPGSLTNAGINGSWPVPGGDRSVNIAGTVVTRLIQGVAFGIAFRSGQSWRTYGQSPSGRIRIQWRQ